MYVEWDVSSNAERVIAVLLFVAVAALFIA
jgi:hypothetical protein